MSIEGEGVQQGGKYSIPDNRDIQPYWVLQPPERPPAPIPGTGSPQPTYHPLNLTFEAADYRSNFGGETIHRIGRWGWYDTYEFGGYIYRSDRTDNADTFRRMIEQLRASDYIDRYTRAITVSTVLLNPATRLGALVTILIETPRLGVIRITPDVLVMQRTIVESADSQLGGFAFTALSAFFFYCLLMQLSRWFYKGSRAYFSGLGNAFDCVIVLISSLVVIDFMAIEYRCPDLLHDDAPLQLLRAGYTINYNMQRASTMYGVLLWLLILRSLKFVPQLVGTGANSLFAHTVEKSAWDLIAFFSTSFVILIAFTCIFHFTLGTYLPEFATLTYAFFTVILGLSSVWEPSHWYDADPVTSILLLLTFTAICSWMLATMVIAIVTESFVAAKADIALQDRRNRLETLKTHAEIEEWVHQPESGHATYRPQQKGPKDNDDGDDEGGSGTVQERFSRVVSNIRATNILAKLGNKSCRKIGVYGSGKDNSSKSDVSSLEEPSGLDSEPSVGASSSGDSIQRGAPRQSVLGFALPAGLAKARALAETPRSQPPSPPPASRKHYMVKGCLWRGRDLTPPDEPVSSYFVRILAQVPDPEAASPGRGSNVDNKSFATLHSQLLANGNRSHHQPTTSSAAAPIVHDQFRSKTIREQKRSTVTKESEYVQWAEKFTLAVPIGIDEVQLVVALYDNGLTTYGRDTLVAYTIVPLAAIAHENYARRRSDSNKVDIIAPNGEGETTSVEGSGSNDDPVEQRPSSSSRSTTEPKKQPVRLEMTLHPATVIRNRKVGGVTHLIRTITGDRESSALHEPKVELSLAVHEVIRPVWNRGRTFGGKSMRQPRSANTTAKHGSGVLRPSAMVESASAESEERARHSSVVLEDARMSAVGEVEEEPPPAPTSVEEEPRHDDDGVELAPVKKSVGFRPGSVDAVESV